MALLVGANGERDGAVDRNRHRLAWRRNAGQRRVVGDAVVRRGAGVVQQGDGGEPLDNAAQGTIRQRPQHLAGELRQVEGDVPGGHRVHLRVAETVDEHRRTAGHGAEDGGCEGDVDGAIARLAAGEIQLGEMPFDPFERDDGWLVARLGDPRRPHWDERVEEAGDGFLVANRKAREPRAWMFGLCPGNPTWAVEKVVQERLDFLDQAQGIAPRRAALEANIEPGGDAVDYQDLQQMAIGNLHTRPGTELTEAMLRAAAWLSVAGRRQGSWRRLKGALWRHFRHLFRDADQRRWYAVYGKRAIKGRAADQAAELLTKIAECWQDHLKVHPGCTLLPRNSRLTLEGLQRALSQEPRDLRQAACREMLRRCIGLRLAQA